MQESTQHRLTAMEITPLVYGDLRRLAARRMRRERRNHTLTPTALLNETFLRLDRDGAAFYNDEGHFLATAARAMRQVLVDYARHRNAAKGSGRKVVLPLDLVTALPAPSDEHILDLNTALSKLEKRDAPACRIVELRYFGGYTEPEIATICGLSERTVRNRWRFARVWLLAELDDHGTSRSARSD